MSVILTVHDQIWLVLRSEPFSTNNTFSTNVTFVTGHDIKESELYKNSLYVTNVTMVTYVTYMTNVTILRQYILLSSLVKRMVPLGRRPILHPPASARPTPSIAKNWTAYVAI